MTFTNPSASFPTSIIQDSEIGLWTNRETNTLATSINANTLSIALSSSIDGWPTSGFITIDSERILYASKDNSTKTITVASTSFRGMDGSTAATHTASSVVTLNVVAFHFNKLLREVQALETAVGTSGSGQFLRADGTVNSTALQQFNLGISTDTIVEKTIAAGVTVDGALLKDGGVVVAASGTLQFGTSTPAILSRGAADRLDLASGDTLRVATDGSSAGLEFGASGDVLLYRGASSILYLASGDSLRLATDGSTGALQLGASGDVNLYRGASGELFTDSHIRVFRTLTTSFAFGAAVTGDTVDRFKVYADGQVEWGPGGASARDVVLTRGAANRLDLASGDTLRIASDGSSAAGNLQLGAAGDVKLWRTGANRLQSDSAYESARALSTNDAFAAAVTGDAVFRFNVTAAGNIEWGDGTSARDVVMARSAANIVGLASGDNFLIATDGSSGALLFGATGDVGLFRGSSNRLDLNTGDSFNIVSGSLLIAGTTVFEADRDFAVSLIPSADDSLDIGSSTRRVNEVYARYIRVHSAISEADGLRLVATGASGDDSPRLMFYNSVTGGATGYSVRSTGSGSALQFAFGATPGSGSGTSAWNLTSSGHWQPAADVTFDVGSASNTVRDLYVGRDLKWKSNTAFTMTLDHAISADRTISYPDGAGTIVLDTLAQTLTNKTLSSPTISGTIAGTYTIGGTPTLSGTLAGNATLSGVITFTEATSPIIAAKLGPNSGQQHALPALASSTLAILGSAQTFTGLKSFTGGILADSILEATLNQGVTIEGTQLVDGYLQMSEIVAPSAPAVNSLRIYSRDEAGTTKLFYKRSDSVEVEIGSPPAGAPSDALYLTLNTNATLTNERVLTAGTGVSFADSGAGGTLTVNWTGLATRLNGGVDVGTRRRLNFIEGSGIAITVVDDAVDAELDITIDSTSGAPETASYVVISSDATLTAERVLTAGQYMSITDNGPNGTVVLKSTPGFARSFLTLGA